ncbi:hypothetical protein HPP92_004923 [Vanilla planifolia]|uniref:Uncharacterized protein n=1 Tax=Vanilla planifolia TaxID=51239 RepID=A0A835RFV1_VANPL|nr:hypothetical protein HPP92_004923 [Vanilla planifolia]
MDSEASRLLFSPACRDALFGPLSSLHLVNLVAKTGNLGGHGDGGQWNEGGFLCSLPVSPAMVNNVHEIGSGTRHEALNPTFHGIRLRDQSFAPLANGILPPQVRLFSGGEPQSQSHRRRIPRIL